MTYAYSCENEKCKAYQYNINIDKPISDASKEEFCPDCKEKLVRSYSSFGLRTFGDGYKS